jgi:hypothetical protein
MPTGGAVHSRLWMPPADEHHHDENDEGDHVAHLGG